MRIKRRKIKPMYFFKAEESDVDTGGGSGDTGDDGGGSGGGAEESSWPDTWREMYAGEDESKLASLSRYASPSAAFDGLIATKNKIRSGEFKSTSPFPDEGTDDQKASWRSENGIPESADKYELNLADGLVIGDNDKPIIDGFLEAAHNGNMSPKDATAAVEWYYDNQEKQAEARAEADENAKNDTEDALRADWGNEYRGNLNRIHNLLDTAPKGIKDSILSSRTADGTPLFSNPDTLKFFIDMALQINPATTLVPGAGDNIAGAISDELKTLEGMMGNKSTEYWKGPKAEDNQKRYRELVEAQEKMK